MPAVLRLGAALLLLLLAVPGAADPALRARLDAALAAPALRGAQLAALVVSERDGGLLYAREADRALVPASNLKVLTALAALAAFGPSHRFRTRVLADGALGADGSVGRLYVRGGGDPAMTSEQWWRLAADLRAQGLRHVRGELVLDDSLFDHERWHPAWGETSSRAYHAPIGALAANYGAFEVWARPGRAPGDAIQVSIDPPVAYLRLVNRAQTGAAGRPRLRVGRELAEDHERVIVTGTLPAGGSRRRFALSVADPTRYAGAVCRLQLEAVGIDVAGATRLGPVPEGAVLLHDFEGLPLVEVMQRFLKWSNNAIGETLVKALGAQATGGPGSWQSGLPALRLQLSRLGLGVEGMNIQDGSGLSTTNRISPRLLVGALRLARDSFGFGPEFVAALPVAAVDGTLRNRAAAASGAARAKTGLLTGATGLSGFARRASGEEVVFSVLVNGYPGSANAAMAALDGFLAELVEPSTSRPPVASEPSRRERDL